MKLIEIGEIVNTHGVRGEIKLNPWTDSLEDLLDIETFYYEEKGETRPLSVIKSRIHKNCAIIQFEGVDTMSEAEQLLRKTLFVEREENLPEGRYYIADLIGLTVIGQMGELGTLTDVFKTGANDVYEVKKPGSKPIYLPALKSVMEEVNIEEGYMKVIVPDGLLDD